MIKHKTANRLVFIVVVLGIAMCIGGWIHGNVVEGYEELKNNDKVEAAIVDELIDEGKAEVIVMLKEQEDVRGIRSIQEEVVNSVENTDFEIKYKYSLVSAMSGSLDKEALEALIANDNVEKIYLNKKLHITLDVSVP